MQIHLSDIKNLKDYSAIELVDYCLDNGIDELINDLTITGIVYSLSDIDDDVMEHIYKCLKVNEKCI